MAESDTDDDFHLDTETRSHSTVLKATDACTVPGLTLLWHPDLSRIGERVALAGLASGRPVELSRRRPEFSAPRRSRLRPLADPHLSRRPWRLLPGTGPAAVRLCRSGSPTPLAVDGVAVADERELTQQDLERGVVMLLARDVVLLLHPLDPISAASEEDFGLVGESPAMEALRRDIRRVAELDVPVLLRGESGTGKELVARAIHRAGKRGEAYVTVNMAAVPPSLAAAELFGSVKGAFTGSSQHRLGYFGRAHRGTLFLDEIGETSAEVQSLLLRALENHEIQPVGADETRQVDVRLIAATDRDLTAAAADGQFRQPLLHRLSVYEIHLPALRERREDFGRLWLYFLRRELEELGRLELLEADRPSGPWMRAAMVARLACYDWPGNVRQLRNVASQLVIASQDEEHVQMRPEIDRMLAGAVDEAPADTGVSSADASSARRRASDVRQKELVAVLRENRWRLQPSARQLGISRPALYDLIAKNPSIRKAADLGRQEIEECMARCDANVNEMVDLLQVSERGLLRRMKQLGLR